jgi:hypothetical protein
MSKPGLSANHAFLLGLMALMVAVSLVTIRVLQENIEARIIMASIWAVIGVWWFVQAGTAKSNSDDGVVRRENARD